MCEICLSAFAIYDYFRYGVLPPSLQNDDGSEKNDDVRDKQKRKGQFERSDNEEKLMEEIKK